MLPATRTRPTRRARLSVERLDGRLLPSTVTNPYDDGSAGSLRYEIAVARSGDTIDFAPELAGQTITLAAGRLVVDKDLTVRGPGSGTLAVSGCAGSFDVRAGAQVAISGLTIRDAGGGGYWSADGAVVNAGTLTLTACTLTGNSAGADGGAVSSTGRLTLNSCTLTGNSAGHAGGAIYSTGPLTVLGGSVTDNTAFQAGGIYHSGTWTSAASITGCTFSGNRATGGAPQAVPAGGDPALYYGYGGAVWNAGAMTLTNCSLTGNSAYDGGAVYNGSSLTLTGCTVSGNTGRLGGGVYNNSDGRLTIQKSTLTQNTAYDLFNDGQYTKDKSTRIGKAAGRRAS